MATWFLCFVTFVGYGDQVAVVCRLNQMLWTDDRGFVILIECNDEGAGFCRLKRMLCFGDRVLLLYSSVWEVSMHTYVPFLHMLSPRVPTVGAPLRMMLGRGLIA